MSQEIIASVDLMSIGSRRQSRTRFTRDGKDVTADISNLMIIRYPGDDDFYLLYCDQNGNELSDTVHETVDRAMAQARFSFGVEKGDWVTGK